MKISKKNQEEKKEIEADDCDLNDPETIKKQVQERVAAERAALEEQKPPDKPDQDGRKSEHFLKDGFLCRWKSTPHGDIPIKLWNVDARIVEEHVLDNGIDTSLTYIIEGFLHGITPLSTLEVSAEKFNGMTWANQWGASCVLQSGQTVRDGARYAVQERSHDIKKYRYFTHTGWRVINGKSVYLHGGGAVGCDERATVSIKLPEGLERYVLPPHPLQETSQVDLQAAIAASLSFLDLAKKRITLPLYAITHLAPLVTLLNPNPNFSAFVYGESGTLKTSIVLIMLGFFGDFSGAENLSNFDDTDGSLELRAFALKDSLHVCDDYHPSSSKAVALQREARLQKIIRSFGNRSARGRLNSDLSIKKTFPPRAMMVITGEEAPGLQSTIARLLTIELVSGDINKVKLSEIQEKRGLLPHAMRNYIEWIGEHMTEIVNEFPRRFRELRAEANSEGLHGRLLESAAFMQYALEKVAAWLLDRGAISNTGADDLLNESWIAFQNLSRAQQRRIQDDNPITQFFDILATLLSQQNLRLCPTVTGGGVTVGAGEVLGWFDEEAIFLDSAGAWHSVQRFCLGEGSHFPFGKTTFYSMLKNKGIIQPAATGECTIVKTIGGRSCRVLKIIDKEFYSKTVLTVI